MAYLRHSRTTSARRLLRLLGPFCLAFTPSWALVRWNDSREQIYLNVSAGASWESNIFATAGGDGDFTSNFSAGLDYQRRAGLIGVNASMQVASAQYSTYSSENSVNPNLSVELNKESGRTTGSVSLHSVRESRADPAANLRTEAWNHNAGVNWKYPVIERYSLSGGAGYSLRDYDDNKVLVDLEAYHASIDLYYVYTSERDLLGGYQFRQSESSTGVKFFDHAFTAGINGKIFPKISGSIRGGYQFRDAVDRNLGRTQEDYSSWTVSGSATWTVSKGINVTSQVAKDFSITSTDISVDTFSGSVDFQMALNGKTNVFAGVNFAFSDFLGAAGDGRHDTLGGFSAGFTRTLPRDIKMSLTYSYSQNWSTEELSDFDRQAVSLNLSTRL